MTFDAVATRRSMLAYGAAGFVLAAAGTIAGRAQAQNAKVPLDQLLSPQALPDVWIGKKDAPVSIVEYALVDLFPLRSFPRGHVQGIESEIYRQRQSAHDHS